MELNAYNNRSNWFLMDNINAQRTQYYHHTNCLGPCTPSGGLQSLARAITRPQTVHPLLIRLSRPRPQFQVPTYSQSHCHTTNITKFMYARITTGQHKQKFNKRKRPSKKQKSKEQINSLIFFFFFFNLKVKACAMSTHSN